MSANKFLNTGGGAGTGNVSNGSLDIYGSTLAADNLDPSRPVKTNSVKQLISTNLDIADINDLQQRLDNTIIHVSWNTDYSRKKNRGWHSL